MSEFSNVFRHIWEVNKRMYTRHPILTAIFFLIYLVFITQFVFKVNLINKTRELFRNPEKVEMQEQIKYLQSRIDQQNQIIETLTKRTKETSFLRKLEFEETWKTNENRNDVLRILEYADFAIQKQDYSRAEHLSQEADRIQDTLTVPFYMGRLYYIQGDLSSAESQWRRVIKLDPQNRYPDVRLYLAIALYEMGKENESKIFINDYLSGP